MAPAGRKAVAKTLIIDSPVSFKAAERLLVEEFHGRGTSVSARKPHGAAHGGWSTALLCTSSLGLQHHRIAAPARNGTRTRADDAAGCSEEVRALGARIAGLLTK